jgi:SNF2-related domain
VALSIERAPEPGQVVRVRQRQYLVEEVVAPPEPGDATLVRVACLDDDNQGQPLEVLWEKEVDPEILTGEAWEHLATRGFDHPRLFAAYLHTLRWNCVTATDDRLFQAPFRAGIRIDAYQLEPLRKALRLPRVNLFIADDVGLGKTIEAGLIVRELLLRKKVKEIVVACPPSMLLQWREELETRFGLAFQILDRDYVARIRQERGYGVNPWRTHARFLVSQRLLIDETYAGPMRDWLGELRPGALLILDEAHHAAPSSGARYAIDSHITRAVRDLAARFEHRLFLSATPHNGHSNSFSALLELLDPQRFCRGVPVRSKKLLDDVMVRRLKEDVREVAGGFPRRTVEQVDIKGLPPDAPELRLSALLDEYRRLREARLQGSSSGDSGQPSGPGAWGRPSPRWPSSRIWPASLQMTWRAISPRLETAGSRQCIPGSCWNSWRQTGRVGETRGQASIWCGQGLRPPAWQAATRGSS